MSADDRWGGGGVHCGVHSHSVTNDATRPPSRSFYQNNRRHTTLCHPSYWWNYRLVCNHCEPWMCESCADEYSNKDPPGTWVRSQPSGRSMVFVSISIQLGVCT